MKTFSILSTKKLDAPVRQQAADAGLSITETEFISIQPIVSSSLVQTIHSLMPASLHVVFTSANAVNAVAEYFRQGSTFYVNSPWQVFCLSGKTWEAVQARFPWMPVLATALDARGLGREIVSHHLPEVVFFCGNQRRDELPQLLKTNGTSVREVVVYETTATPRIETTSFDAVLFFSPSAVESFFSVNQLSKAAACFAIGETTAQSIADHCDNKVVISETRDQEGMIRAVEFYLHNINLYQ